jgi:tetratricopeptide (TPR) repeat protein
MAAYAQPSLASDRDSLFAAGKAQYEVEAYEAAIKTWQSLLARGEGSYALYHELGNAYYRINEIGEAVLYYEKAHKLKPWDKDIQFNVHLARQRVQDRFAIPPAFFPLRMWRLLRDRFQPPAWFWMGVVFCWLACVWQAFRWYSKSATRFRPSKAALVLLLLSIMAISMGFDRQSFLEDEASVVLLADSQEVRKVPDNKGEMAFKINEGIKVRVLDALNGWWQVELPDGRKGWVLPESWGRV